MCDVKLFLTGTQDTRGRQTKHNTITNTRCKMINIQAGGFYAYNYQAIIFYFSFQLKFLFEIFTFVSERNIKYQYLILASLILIACYRNSVSHFSTIKYVVSNHVNSDHVPSFSCLNVSTMKC
jgi:hypothetical protein